MKKAVILLIILAALIAVALTYEKGLKRRVNSAALVGAPNREFVLPDIADKEVGGLRVREGEKKVNLSLASGRWTVAERSNYSASFDKVQRAVKLVSELKVKGKQVVGKSVLGEVKLLSPEDGPADQTGLQIELQDAKGANVGALVVGGSTSTSGGASSSGSNMFGGPGELRYARVPGKDGDTAWFVEDSFYELSSDPKDWLDKSFIDVRKLQSAEITPAEAGQAWKVERKDEDTPYALVNAAPGEETDTAKVDGLNTVLSNAMLTDVMPKDKVTPDFMKGAVTAKLATSEGFTYDIQAVSKKEGGADATEKNYVTVKVSADIPKERKAPADEKPDDKKKNDDSFAANKKSLEDKLAKEKSFEGWVFEVPNYTVAVLFKKRSEILREKQPPIVPPPDSATPPPAPGATPGPVKPPSLQPPPAIPSAPSASPSAAPSAAPKPAAKPASAPTPSADAKPASATPPAADAKPANATPPTAKSKPAEAKTPDAKPADPEAPQTNPAPAAPPAKPPGQ